MLLNDFKDLVQTPAFIYDEEAIFKRINDIRKEVNKKDCRLLFPLKAFTIINALYFIATLVDGFSVSSLFEAKLAGEVLGNNKSIHLTTPGIKNEEINELSKLCDYISFNSLSQWENYQNEFSLPAKIGLRLNPKISLVTDTRYNPCRRHSKLGIPLDKLCSILNNNLVSFENINGLHFHTNCESNNFIDLLKTVKYIVSKIPAFIEKLSWINLGGGYLFEHPTNPVYLTEAIDILRRKSEINIFIEPGKGIIGNAGYIISTVLDIFENDGRNIAILDTTVNHMPEVFEYQYKPDILEESTKGKYRYILAGATCLAGDIFGDYRFDAPLKVGSKIVFEGMGAYTIVKANMFNGINLPGIYAYTTEGNLELKRQFGYNDFILKYGDKNNVTK